jgi:uncharacterized protein YdbL (DUF1318 family)
MGVRLPSRMPMQAPELESVPPAAPQHRPREQTLVGLGPAAPQSETAPPPRNLSPNPESLPAVDIRTPFGRATLTQRIVRNLWVWLAPLLLSAVGTIGGYLKGYLWGLAAAHDDIVQIRSAQKRDHDKLTELEGAESDTAAALATETQSNRTERSTRDRNYLQLVKDFEDFKKGVPAIQGLPSKK